jgi:two-component system, response regulator RpfG
MATVLVVDDQLISRMIMETILRSISPEILVVSYEDPISALNWAKNNRVDLVLTDYKMPNMDGVEFTQWLRKIPACSDVPLIVITCHDDKSLKHRALDAGATDFLSKPVDSAECRARCRNLLALREQQSIIRDRAAWLEQQVEEKTRDLRLRERETLLRLARAGEYRDNETGGHIMRMGHTSRMIAQAMGMGEEFLDTIEQAAPMHDIGKIGIPDAILQKPGPLTAAERQLMQRHTLIGYEILRDSPSHYLQAGATIAWCHHERFDGSGYPRGLKGSAIPTEASIVALADVFDALLSKRPYKQPWSMERTIDHITQQRGGQFAPDCVDALLENIDSIAHTRQLFPSEHQA